MARAKLDLNEEERRQYNNRMHREQAKRRREKVEREGFKEVVWAIMNSFETLGWDETDLVVGADDKMVDAVVEELIKSDKFKITLGSKISVKIK